MTFTQIERESVTHYLRAHIMQKRKEKQAPPLSRTNRVDTIQHDKPQYWLCFDTETTIDARQAMRFGCYELYGSSSFCSGETLLDSGFFTGELTENELITMGGYASEHKMRILTQEKFVQLLYHFGHNSNFDTTIIGHNLPFDLSRLTREISFPQKSWKNGFALKLCTCDWQRKNGKHYPGDSCKKHPSIRLKKISARATLIAFSDRVQGQFLDTATLARSILGPGPVSLAALGKLLSIDEQKLEDDIEHGALLTDQYLDYACRDVRATYQIFDKLRSIYTGYNLSKKMHKIYSEASLGKALYKDLNITSPMSRMLNIPEELHGYAMTAYYGGRSEVHFRQSEQEIAYCDFKSQYPTVFELMGLQEMLLAESYSVEDVTHDVQARLLTFSLENLQSKDYWQSLRVLCKISGENLILPVRAKFNKTSNNIAVCNVKLDKPVWYCLSDVLANILMGGAIPTIEEALEIIPHGQIATNKLEMFDGLVSLNPGEAGIFTTLINERTRLKALKETIEDKTEKDRLGRAEIALKLLANSTSYGVNIELQTDENTEELSLYCNDGELKSSSKTTQIPGPYYCPLIGCHIPAGGRLLLAIAQRLGEARGLSYAMCDTDSISFVKPPELALGAFKRYITEVLNFFQPLYPYSDNGYLLELEKYNFVERDKELVWTPLFFLGISAKRYVLYNLIEGRIILRKVSSHGLGAFRINSKDYLSPASIPAPEYSFKDLGLNEHGRWIYDLWYQFVQKYQIDSENWWHVNMDKLALNVAASRQTVLSTAYLFKLFQHIPGVLPFNFVTTFFQFPERTLQHRISEDYAHKVDYEKCVSSLYLPFTTNLTGITNFFVVKTNDSVHVKPLTIQEALYDYFHHHEHKSLNGYDSGEMQMRHVEIKGYVPMGKESSYEVLALEDVGLPESLARESIDLEYTSPEMWQEMIEEIRGYGVLKMAKELAMSKSTFSRLLQSQLAPHKEIIQAMRNLLQAYPESVVQIPCP